MFVRRQVLPNDASDKAGGWSVRLQNKGIGRCFSHRVRVEVLCRYMQRVSHNGVGARLKLRTGNVSSIPLKSKSWGLPSIQTL